MIDATNSIAKRVSRGSKTLRGCRAEPCRSPEAEPLAPPHKKCDSQRSRMIRWSDVVGNIGGFMQQRVVKTGDCFVRACDAPDAR